MNLKFRPHRETKTFIRFYVLFIIGLFTVCAHAQENGNTSRHFKKESLIISSNAIYNYFTNKTVINIVNPDGRIPNSRQIVYYWRYKYYDTYTFDLSLNYNRFLTNYFSFSGGVRLDQLKSVKKTTLYVDSNSSLPDIKKYTRSRYSGSIPFSANFYLKKFKFSLGVYAYVFSITRTTNLYEQGIKDEFYSSNFGLEFLGQETLGFKLFRNRSIYAQLGVFHNFRFKNNYGYNKHFTLGLSCGFFDK